MVPIAPVIFTSTALAGINIAGNSGRRVWQLPLFVAAPPADVGTAQGYADCRPDATSRRGAASRDGNVCAGSTMRSNNAPAGFDRLPVRSALTQGEGREALIA
jgi:hypothetical protein